MRKFYIASFLLVLTSLAFAQSQFTPINCFQLNDSAKLGFAVVSESFDNFISQTGSNYTWDFTNTGMPGPWTSWTSPTASYQFRPSTQSNHTPFAATEINEYALVAFARDNFYTYSPNQDTLYTDGFYNSSNKVYLPRIPYLSFPLSFSDSVYTHTLQSGGTAVGPGSVSRYWVYDGFGTVKLPYGTQSNVYRIRTKQVDSSSVLNSILATTEELIWFRQSDGIPILRFVKQGPNTIAAYYASVSGASGIYENGFFNSISTYPNPFSDKIVLVNPENEKIRQATIYNSLGQPVLTVLNQDLFINTQQLEKGIYFVEVHTDRNSVYRNVVIKQN